MGNDKVIFCSLIMALYYLFFIIFPFFLLKIGKIEYFCRFYAKKDNISYFYCNFAADITLLHNNFKIRREIMEKRLSLFFVCLLMSIGAAFAQIDVSGTVISADDNEPIIGASVLISGGGSH